MTLFVAPPAPPYINPDCDVDPDFTLVPRFFTEEWRLDSILASFRAQSARVAIVIFGSGYAIVPALADDGV